MSEKRKILLVEDEVLVAAVVADALVELGFDVEETTTAAAALDRIKSDIDGISAAVIDIGLPDRRGDELAVELRTLRPNLPIIIASGQGETLSGPLKGARGLVTLGKPYDMDALQSALSKLGLR
jgi:DNA-binding response OmpR family regulator